MNLSTVIASQFRFINCIFEMVQKVSKSLDRPLSACTQPSGDWETETSEFPKDNQYSQSNYANQKTNLEGLY